MALSRWMTPCLVAATAVVCAGCSSADEAANSSTVATAAPTSADPRSDTAVVHAADTDCDKGIYSKFRERGDVAGSPVNESGWSITTANPVGSPRGSSWRLTAEYSIQVDAGGKVRRQFMCDLTWNERTGMYDGRIVG